MYYILESVFTGHKLTLRPMPYTERGFSTYSRAYHHMRRYGGDTVVREDRVSLVIDQYERRNN